MELKLILDRFEENDAVFISEDKKSKVFLSMNSLPRESKEGDVFLFKMKSDEDETLQKKELAKDILNEILDAQEKTKDE